MLEQQLEVNRSEAWGKRGFLICKAFGAREAFTQLELFLRTMRSRGEQCFLVIHGKGAHSPDGSGVLLGGIAAWLSQSAASEHVAAFATATGGDGAVYVLLRRLGGASAGNDQNANSRISRATAPPIL